MGIQDTLTLVMALVGGIATAWFMVRDVVPLAIRAIRRHRKRCADRKARLAAENQKQEKREEVNKIRSDFCASIVKLRGMEKDEKSYYRSEWKLQIQNCIASTISIMKAMNIEIGRSSVTLLPAIVYFEEFAIIIEWGPLKARPGQVVIGASLHPKRNVTAEELSFEPEIAKQAEPVFRRALSAQQLSDAEWACPDKWR